MRSLFQFRQQLHFPNVHLLNFSFEKSGSYFANNIADAILIQELISGVLEWPSMGNIAEQLKVLHRQYGWLQEDLACEPGVSFPPSTAGKTATDSSRNNVRASVGRTTTTTVVITMAVATTGVETLMDRAEDTVRVATTTTAVRAASVVGRPIMTRMRSTAFPSTAGRRPCRCRHWPRWRRT